MTSFNNNEITRALDLALTTNFHSGLRRFSITSQGVKLLVSMTQCTLTIKAMSISNPNFFIKHHHEIASIHFTFINPKPKDTLCISGYEMNESPLDPSVVCFDGIADAYRERAVASQMVSQAAAYYSANQAGLVKAIFRLAEQSAY